MKYRAVLIDPAPVVCPEPDKRHARDQRYGDKIESLRQWAAGALKGREGARVEIYEVVETLVDTITRTPPVQPPAGR